MFAQQQPTIAAIATPGGNGAIGMIRMSGRDSIKIVDGIFRAYNGVKLRDMPGYTGVLGRLVRPNQPTGEHTVCDSRQCSGRDCQRGLPERGDIPIDEVVVFVYSAPKSYTGEDVVEICCHGGSYLVRETLRICLEQGARLAEPGEFTKRAFLAGKMNLTQAEAVCDLISAQTEGARKVALAAKDGALSTAIKSLVERIIASSAHLAAWADYPEEDIIDVDLAELETALRDCIARMDTLLRTYDRGRLVREGVETVIAGKPNVGKSTLMNLLTGTRRSIVTDIPGTTRDIVEDRVVLGEYLLILSDTAGIRDTRDEVERQGVELAFDKLKSASLVLAVFDSSTPLDDDDYRMLEALTECNCVGILNKSDLPPQLDEWEIRARLGQIVAISAQSGEGREELERVILSLLKLDVLDTSAAIVASERQRHCLICSRDALIEALDALSGGMTLDAVNVCIDSGLDALLSLTGEKVTESVVDEIFSRFCVGK